MTWLAVVLIGHFLNAVAFVIDKILLTKSFQNPFVYAFFIGILGLLAVVLIPFGFEFPSLNLIVFNFVTGALFIAALLFFFHALKGAEASRIVPFIGGGIPLFTWIFELLFLDEQLSNTQLFAFAVLVIGTILIAIDLDNREVEGKEKQGIKAWILGLAAAVFFAVSFGMTKYAFETQTFISAFVWMRFGSFIFVLLFLFSAKNRKAIKDSVNFFKEKTGAFFLLSQSFGAGGFMLINYAISLASVSLVNALQGVQYAFLLLMAIVGTLKYPKLLKESMSTRSLVIKVIAVFVIGIGLYLIAQNPYA